MKIIGCRRDSTALGVAAQNRYHPLEGPLSTPDTSPCLSLPGVAWFRTFVLGQYLLVAALRARVLVYSVRRSAPATHRDQGTGAGNRLQHPWHFVPPENLRFQVVSKAEDSRSELPRGTGRQHVVARDLGASPAKSNTAGGRGSIRQKWVGPGTYRSSLPTAEINQRPAWPGTALGRALRRSRRGPFCGLPPVGQRAGWCEPFFVRSTSWPVARIGWQNVRPR